MPYQPRRALIAHYGSCGSHVHEGRMDLDLSNDNQEACMPLAMLRDVVGCSSVYAYPSAHSKARFFDGTVEAFCG